MPSELLRWRRARAELSHDWLERGLLGRLETTSTLDRGNEHVSAVCWRWWENDICPRLKTLLEMLPDAVLPSTLVRPFAGATVGTAIDAAVVAEGQRQGADLNLQKTRTHALMLDAETELRDYFNSPDDARRQRSLVSCRALLSALRDLPRTILLP